MALYIKLEGDAVSKYHGYERFLFMFANRCEPIIETMLHKAGNICSGLRTSYQNWILTGKQQQQIKHSLYDMPEFQSAPRESSSPKLLSMLIHVAFLLSLLQTDSFDFITALLLLRY